MPPNMSYKEYPYSTVDSAISVFDNDNQYRPLAWTDAINTIDWLEKQDNGQLLTLLERLPSPTDNVLTNPRINWTEAVRLDDATTLTATITSSGTTLTVDEPRVARVGSYLFFHRDNEIARVTAVDDANSQWTIVRGEQATTGVAKSVDDPVIVLPSYMAEKSGAREGMGQLPGTGKHQFISMASLWHEVTKMQNQSQVYDNWGQVPRAQVETILAFRRRMANGLFFANRHTELTANEGQLYIGGGVLSNIKSNVLDLDTYASNVKWAVWNAYFENLFDHDASSDEKTCICGENLWRTLLSVIKDRGDLEDGEPLMAPVQNTMAFTLNTDSGQRVVMLKDKYGLKSGKPYYLGDWAFALDLGHIQNGHYNGFDAQWFQNIQGNDDILMQKDAYFQSWALLMKHEKCHGVIRGGVGQHIRR